MNLVEINECYINTDKIDVVRPHHFEDTRGNIYPSTHIFISGNEIPFVVYKPIDEVIKILGGQ